VRPEVAHGNVHGNLLYNSAAVKCTNIRRAGSEQRIVVHAGSTRDVTRVPERSGVSLAKRHGPFLTPGAGTSYGGGKLGFVRELGAMSERLCYGR
jgi:hypothetical protein